MNDPHPHAAKRHMALPAEAVLVPALRTIRRLIGWPAAALSVALLLGAPVMAQEAITVQGEILDLACYMAKGSKGPQHRACAKMCVKKGAPMGILTEEGDVFLLVDDHNNPDPYEDLKELAGSNAEVTGKKFVRGGVSSIMVTESSGL